MVEAVLPKTILQFAFFLHRPAGPCLVAVVAAEEAIQIRTSYHVLRVQVEATSTRKRRCPVAAAEAEEAAECLSWQPRPNSPSRTICTEDWASENRSRCSDRHCPKPMPAAEAVEVATLFPSFGYLASPCPPSLVDGCCWSLYFLLLASNDCSTTYPENDFACCTCCPGDCAAVVLAVGQRRQTLRERRDCCCCDCLPDQQLRGSCALLRCCWVEAGGTMWNLDRAASFRLPGTRPEATDRGRSVD